MRNGITLTILLFFVLLTTISCSTMYLAKHSECAENEYITPDPREFSFGSVYKNKYWNETTGVSKCVTMKGKAKSIAPAKLDGESYILLNIEVEGAVSLIPVYATSDFDKAINSLRQDQEVTVYGKVLPLGSGLAIFLKEIK